MPCDFDTAVKGIYMAYLETEIVAMTKHPSAARSHYGTAVTLVERLRSFALIDACEQVALLNGIDATLLTTIRNRKISRGG
jgi:hypothetical protein